MTEHQQESLEGKQVLITGGLGFIGSNLARKCLEAGAAVTVYDCLDPHSGGNMSNIDDIKDQLTLSVNDILNFEKLCESVIDKDLVVNCAASTSHAFSMREPWVDQDVNSKAVINLLEAVRRFNPTVKLVHLGTTTQLGTLRYEPADEKHPEFPTDIYSANKSVSEKYVLIYANSYNLRATVLRLSNVYGPRASIHSPEFTFNNFFLGLAMQDKPITVYGEGNQLRNLIHVDDVVTAIEKTFLNPDTDGEVFFVTGDNHISIAGIAAAIVEAAGKGEVKHIEWPAERKSTEFGNAIISNDKLKQATGWLPSIVLEEGLRETVAFYRDRLDEYLRK
ncbi:MAG: NAD-dependent epimerase/dehydratase family protein [Pseudomonadales bacterium]|nr:NAD-dependent epimerase/dehydratase family protein [Pseudomonadales bacterium]